MGGFGTIYKAFWKNEGIKIVFKCPDKLNENLDEFLNEWDCHEKCLQSNAIIYLHGFTKKPDTSNPDTSTYMVVMDYASEVSPFNDLMKRCWNEDPLKRPSSEEIEETIKSWIFRPYDDDWKEISSDKISKELKSNIMEFINAPIGNNNLITESHPQAYYTSRLLDFTSKEVNEILESKCLDCIVEDSIKSLNIEADETN
ncbi:kinase-like domain-containing protein [Rhizophagus clarus]|uniref:Kinase-like domain-containing protein n=1 Tax=Rhizophagus clarus TaxID=94130 RepID=A0A8H3LYQ0_9GLOM|nr:kinase-like domain-containing protein [Rhizophagus clarus]